MIFAHRCGIGHAKRALAEERVALVIITAAVTVVSAGFVRFVFVRATAHFLFFLIGQRE